MMLLMTSYTTHNQASCLPLVLHITKTSFAESGYFPSRWRLSIVGRDKLTSPHVQSGWSMRYKSSPRLQERQASSKPP